ncbi:hypothetical protein CBR_g22453 [Chara braunii]|uniref:Glycoside hydrolase family 38 N-terminal domain-containing protein n=1 Tax=Chara braunii TaxID=69332 RepID=A0A388L300_CHABU|nr:hypothetical protein CBR_g22453 [Chara braunii]|eukprot:GBG76573.1 hypothetical protein CBR_g22453 [Chara braunii]
MGRNGLRPKLGHPRSSKQSGRMEPIWAIAQICLMCLSAFLIAYGLVRLVKASHTPDQDVSHVARSHASSWSADGHGHLAHRASAHLPNDPLPPGLLTSKRPFFSSRSDRSDRKTTATSDFPPTLPRLLIDTSADNGSNPRRLVVGSRSKLGNPTTVAEIPTDLNGSGGGGGGGRGGGGGGGGGGSADGRERRRRGGWSGKRRGMTIDIPTEEDCGFVGGVGGEFHTGDRVDEAVGIPTDVSVLSNSTWKTTTLQLMEEIPFLNEPGGVWTQGWELNYSGNEWNEEKLKVFIVPHSHNDPGWIQTFRKYYESKTRLILNNIVAALKQDRQRRFIWMETSFLREWWEESTLQARRDLQSLALLEITYSRHLQYHHIPFDEYKEMIVRRIAT